jgi:hypothetical protein
VNLLEALGQAIRIPELRRKLLFTLGLLGAFRILAAIAIPGTNPTALAELFSGNTLLGLLNLFSGGGLQRFTLVALGLNPYINATIIMQLMTVVSVRLKELSKEGEIGRKKITRYTRWLTVPLAMLQAFGYLALFQQPVGNAGPIIANPTAATEISIILTLTAGTIIAMWLGELITEYGVADHFRGHHRAAPRGYRGLRRHRWRGAHRADRDHGAHRRRGHRRCHRSTAGATQSAGAIRATSPQRAHWSSVAGATQLLTTSS